MATEYPMERKPAERLALSIREAAEALGVSMGHVINLIQRKELPAKKLGRQLKINKLAVIDRRVTKLYMDKFGVPNSVQRDCLGGFI